MTGPPTLEPFTIEKTSKPNCTSCIGIELQVGGGGDPGIKKERPPVPLSEKYLPHLNIPGKFLVQTDMMKTIFYPAGEVYNALKEGSTRDYYSASKLQSTDKGLEI